MAALVGSAVVTGALAGFGAGVTGRVVNLGPGPLDAGSALVVLLVSGVAAEGSWTLFGRPRPWSIGRQVPREWSSIFSPVTTAILYGARLGVGPLTQLSTWMWWIALGGGALLGVGPSVLIGTVFALIRLLVTIAVSLWAEGPRHQQRFARLQRAQRPGWRLLLGIALVGGFVISGCSPDRPELDTSGPMLSPRPDDRNDQEGTPVTEPAPTRITTTTDSEPATMPTPTEPPTESVPTPTEPPTESVPTTESVPAADRGLDPALLDAIPAFTRIVDPAIDRPLDLVAAAAIQPDPTEEQPLLETRGFRQGWTRAFRSDPSDVGLSDVVVATVYEFEGPTEAAFYLEDGLITIGGYGGRFFDVPTIEGARGFVQEFEADGSPVVSIGVTFVREARWYLLYLVGDPATANPEIVTAAALRQAERVSTGG